MQCVSTYNSHLQAKLRTVIAITVWLCAFGIQYGLQCFAAVFYIHNVTYIYYTQPHCKAITVLSLA